jgi:hypothetical protein
LMPYPETLWVKYKKTYCAINIRHFLRANVKRRDFGAAQVF